MDGEAAAHHTNSNDFGADLKQVRTEGSITITPEMFERMYLSPENRVKGDLRRTFANPTPVGLGGFLVAYSPIIFALLGWRGTGAMGAATVGTYYFSGGLLAILAAIGEFFLGNSFPAVFFGVYGGFFLSYGATLTPAYNAYIAFDPTQPTEAIMAPGFLSGIAYWTMLMGIFSFYCTICALRTNILFTLAFFFLILAFTLFAASLWTSIEGTAKTVQAHQIQIAAGSCGFVTLVIGWYLLLALMLSTVDFPLQLPVGDLSTVIKGATEIRKAKMRKQESPDLEKSE